MGAGAIQKLLQEIDLDALSNELKEELASMVAEQFKTYFVGGEDLNDVVNSGYYLSNGKTIQNIPVQTTYFFVVACAYNGGNVFQMFINNNGSIYVRSKYATTWYEWKQIS